MPMSSVRLGIIGAGKISQDYARAFRRGLPKNKITALACSDEARGKEFCKEHQVDKLYTNYDDILEDANVDLIYVGLISSEHYSTSLKALNKKKPVICEKPAGLSLLEVHDLILASRLNGVFFMEAMWSRFTPAYLYLRTDLDAGVIGNVTQLDARFEVPIANVPRLHRIELGGGAMVDIGIYLVHLAVFVLPYKQLVRIHASGSLFDSGCDKSATITLEFAGGVTAHLTYSTACDGDTGAVIYGDKGKIELPEFFWTPTKMITNGKVREFPLDTPEEADKYHFKNSENLKFEAQHVVKCVSEGKVESPLLPHSETLAMSEIMFTVLRQLGVSYTAKSE